MASLLAMRPSFHDFHYFLLPLSNDTTVPAVMDEILEKYKRGKFQKCLELLKLLPDTDDVVSDFVQENNELVCELMVIITQKKLNKIPELQRKLRLFFDKVISMDTLTFIPVQLKLTAFLNLVFSVLFYNDDLEKREEGLEYINKGLLRVLGKQISFSSTASTSDKIINNIRSLKSLIYTEDQYAVDLVLELVTVTVLYVLKLKRILLSKCVNVVGDFVLDLKRTVSATKSLNEFSNPNLTPLCLFKFGLNKRESFISDPNAVDNLHILESTLLYLTKDFAKSLKSLQKTINCCVKNLWYYLGVVNSYKLKNWDLCLGFLTKSSSLLVQANLKARFYLMHGKLCGVERDHKEALKYFEYALTLSPECPVVYFYIGQEYGKMGIYDLMVENFEKLVKIFVQKPEVESHRNFEALILDWIHPGDEISKTEALFALAVSYGLNERFQKAAETFDELFRQSTEPTPLTERIIPMPYYVTVLHEASIMNLLTGNLVRAEQLALDAQDRFVPRPPPKKQERVHSLLDKDVDWLQKTIHQELFESDLEPKELKPELFYPEEVIFGFPQNIIALLIISEIQRIQEIDDYKRTLTKILSMFTCYISSMYKKEEVSEDENYVWTLVKALAGKTCLRIVEVLTKSKEETNVEKMLKRALSCNGGDKDALYLYYNYLSNKGRNGEALKLWRTFHKKQATVTADDVQSFSLRYFLESKITKRELEKIEIEIELMSMDLS